MDIEKLFIPYEEALELKKLRFDEKCLGAYKNKGKLEITTSDYWDNQSIIIISNGTTCKLKCLAPLYQQAFDFFRKEYSLFHNIWNYTHNEPAHIMIPYRFIFSIDEDWICIVGKKHETGLFEKYYDSYELAELACLRKLIELAKQQE